MRGHRGPAGNDEAAGGELDGLLGDGSDDVPEMWPPAGRRRSRLRRFATIGLILVIAGAVAGLGTGVVLGRQLSGKINRVSGAFRGIDPSERPASSPVPGGQTILAVGIDVRSTGQTTGLAAADPQAAQGGERSDTIMLIRFSTARHTASVVSIPRDSWVPVPGHGQLKINAAYALGGPPLLIRTVEQLTSIRVDHFMIIDFAGFQSIVDALHGVDVPVDVAATGSADTPATGSADAPETQHLDGAQALTYVRQRYGLPEGDLDRIRHQQEFLRGVLAKVAATNPAGDPLQTYRLLDAITQAVTVDDGYTGAELRSLALDAVRLRSGKVWFRTAAVHGLGEEGDQSVVYLDPTRNAQLWQAFENGDLSSAPTAVPTPTAS
jgi:LCP family protein required for cell wall assembly